MFKNRVDYTYQVANIQQYTKVIESLELKYPVNEHMPVLYHGAPNLDLQINNKKSILGLPNSQPTKIKEQLIGNTISLPDKLNWFNYELANDSIDIQPEQFLAYAHHEGVETNLLEVTKHPLVALFYALDNQISKEGYVYIYHSPISNVTSLFKETDNINLSDILLTNDQQLIDHILHIFLGEKLSSKNSYKNQIINHCRIYYQLLNNSNKMAIHNDPTDDSLHKMIKNIVKYDSSDYLKTKYQNSSGCASDVSHYFIALRGVLRLQRQTESTQFPIYKSGALSLYNPSLNFKKGLSQDNLFIYQNYALNCESTLISLEPIVPVTAIKITNKENILKTLDKFNINRNSVYGDHISTTKDFVISA